MNKRIYVAKFEFEIDKNISSEYFLDYILEKSYELLLMKKDEIDKINFSRMNLLKTQLEYYTRRESSSVMLETAQSINKCNDYTIGFYLKRKNSIDKIINELKNESISDIFMKGNKYIKLKVLENKNKIKRIKGSKLNVDNYSYNDTINYGIPLFFKQYNDFFKAHESPGSIDYQLCLGNFEYAGIEYINEYLRRLEIEEEFLKHFPIEQVKELVKSYDEKSELLLLNIFELVLTNVLGLMICEKNIIYLDIKEGDIKKIRNRLNDLSLEEIKKILLMKSEVLCKILNIKNEELHYYIKESIGIIATNVKNALDLDTLGNIFITFKENFKIIYEDRKRLEDSVFRHIINDINNSKSIDEKMRIIKGKIKSLYDMVDMLNSECLYNREYNIFLSSLSEEEFILLFKYIDEEYGYCDDVWKEEVYAILNSMNKEKIDYVRKTIKKIEFQ